MDPTSRRRDRTPRGPIPAAQHSSPPALPPLLSIAAAYPFHTVRYAPSSFVPDAQMTFHVLGICDQMMNTTPAFLRSSPAWLPIVSHLYISVLWNAAVLMNSDRRFADAEFLHFLTHSLGITDCMIPGPLVPFFESLSPYNGPHHRIKAAMPDFRALWNSELFHPNPDYARQIPIPAVILDQLHYFSQWPIPANQTSAYANFEWYRNVFSQGVGTYNPHNRIGPQLCGSLFTTQSQFDTARRFWNSALGSGITRANANRTDLTLVNLAQLFGFESQTGTPQLYWFEQITLTMHNYACYFNQSAPLSSVLNPQNGAVGAVAVRGVPSPNAATLDWFYPNVTDIKPFTSARFPARREIPNEMAIVFQHAEYCGLDENSERYAIVAHTNIRWAPTLVEQNGWTGVAGDRLHEGDYWRMVPFRHTMPVRLEGKFACVIASRYHQDYLDDLD